MMPLPRCFMIDATTHLLKNFWNIFTEYSVIFVVFVWKIYIPQTANIVEFLTAVHMFVPLQDTRHKTLFKLDII